MAVDNSVYDVTAYISEHPAGTQIIDGCGQDATSLYRGVDKHRLSANTILERFKIGVLSK